MPEDSGDFIHRREFQEFRSEVQSSLRAISQDIKSISRPNFGNIWAGVSVGVAILSLLGSLIGFFLLDKIHGTERRQEADYERAMRELDYRRMFVPATPPKPVDPAKPNP